MDIFIYITNPKPVVIICCFSPFYNVCRNISDLLCPLFIHIIHIIHKKVMHNPPSGRSYSLFFGYVLYYRQYNPDRRAFFPPIRQRRTAHGKNAGGLCITAYKRTGETMNTLTLFGAPDTAVTILSNEFLDYYMPKASGEFVKVYLYFLRYCTCPASGVSLASAADTFCMTENDILRALKYWEREGLMALRFEGNTLLSIQLLPLPQKHSQSAAAPVPLPAQAAAATWAAAANRSSALPSGAQAGAAAGSSSFSAVSSGAQSGSAAGSGSFSTVSSGAQSGSAPGAAPFSAVSSGSQAGAAAGSASVPDAAALQAGPAAVPQKPNMYNGTPAYTAAQMEHFKKVNDDQLFFVIEQYLGKPLGPTDVNKIVYFGEGLGFSSELIEYLFEYCVSNNHYSIHYIEQTALAWARDGIDTVAKARARSTYYNKTCFDILKAFGITNRNPAPSEMEHIRRWTREYGFPMPIILEACKRTIEATHAPSFSYAQSILKGWYENKVGSLDDVRRLDEIHARKKQAAQSTGAPSAKAAPGSYPSVGSVSAGKSAGNAPAGKPAGSAPAGKSGAYAGTNVLGSQRPRSTNKFHNFEQRSYDYGKLEQALFKKSLNKSENKTDGGKPSCP